MKSTKKSIVKDSVTIHNFLLKRIEELKLKPADIIKDAADRGMKIESASLSKYLKHGNCKGGLSEEILVWLCTRWDIDLTFIVGTPKIDNNKLKIILPPYNEEKALAKLKVLF